MSTILTHLWHPWIEPAELLTGNWPVSPDTSFWETDYVFLLTHPSRKYISSFSYFVINLENCRGFYLMQNIRKCSYSWFIWPMLHACLKLNNYLVEEYFPKHGKSKYCTLKIILSKDKVWEAFTPLWNHTPSISEVFLRTFVFLDSDNWSFL